MPAAFARLCVETTSIAARATIVVPAASVRLCVETSGYLDAGSAQFAAAFARLCVETPMQNEILRWKVPSRLRAAVC